MVIKKFGKWFGLSEEDTIEALAELGYVKKNGTPNKEFIKSGLFTANGELNYKGDFKSVIENEIAPAIQSIIKTWKIEELESTIGQFKEKLESFETRLSKLEDQETGPVSPVKKARKPRVIDWSKKARSMIGKKYNGWSITGDKLDVVAKKGKKEVRVAGMKNKEDFIEMLDDAD